MNLWLFIFYYYLEFANKNIIIFLIVSLFYKILFVLFIIWILIVSPIIILTKKIKILTKKYRLKNMNEN